MELITAPLSATTFHSATLVDIPVDRHTLAKRRWRATATDGRDFGFDLEHPLADGDVVFAGDGVTYRVAQCPEGVLAVELTDPAEAARVGWMLGNLHFRIAVSGGTVYAPDDPAVRQLLEREHVHFHELEAVFRPVGGAHSHGPHAH